MKVENAARTPVIVDGKMTQICVTLNREALEDLDNISEVAERKTGCVPSRSAVVRAALRAYWLAIK